MERQRYTSLVNIYSLCNQIEKTTTVDKGKRLRIIPQIGV